MKSKTSPSVCLTVAVLLFVACSPAFSAAKKPLALFGMGYEIDGYVEALLEPNNIVYRNWGSWLPVEEFDEYSVVIICQQPEREWSGEEVATVKAYVESGGRVVFVNLALRNLGWSSSLIRPLLQDLTSADGINALESPAAAKAVEAIVVGGATIEAGEDYPWTTFGVYLTGVPRDYIVLADDVTTPQEAFFTKKQLGNGSVFFVGTLVSGIQDSASLKDHVAFLATHFIGDNVLRGGEIPEDVGDRELAFWKEPYRSGLPKLGSVAPLSDLVANQLNAVLASNEKEALDVYMLTKNYEGEMAISLEWDKPLSATLWERVEPLNILQPVSEISVNPGIPRHLWVVVDSASAPPGAYQGNMVFTMKTGENQDKREVLPLEVQIYGSRLPETNLIHLMGYSVGVGFLNSFGSISNEELLQQYEYFFENMRNNRVDTLMLFIDPYTVLNKLKAGSVSVLMSVLQGTLPPAEEAFEEFDQFINLVKQYGFRPTIVLQTNREALLPLAMQMSSKDSISVDSPEFQTHVGWFLLTLSTYFNNRGFSDLYVKIMDEIAADTITQWLADATFFSSHGWRPFTTLTGETAQQASHLKKLNPECENWHVQILNLHNFCSILSADTAAIDQDEEVWFYAGAENLNEMSYLWTRLWGWLACYYGVDGYAFWNYHHWRTTGAAVETNGKLFSTPALEGIRDGIEDAQLCANYLQSQGKDLKACRQPSGQVALPVGLGPQLPLTLSLQSHKGKWDYLGFSDPSETSVLEAKQYILKQLTGPLTPPKDFTVVPR